MKKRLTVFLLAVVLLLSGCEGKEEQTETSAVPSTAATEETVPVTIPADGDPDDVTCKGSYTGSAPDVVVATSGTAELTNEQLQVWYWGEVSQYQQEDHEIAPDLGRPLDTQACQIDSSVYSWQQYFLKQALSAWHSAQALVQHGAAVPLPTEEAYQPDPENHEKYLTGMPATSVLYGYQTYYRPNSMHQAYLDELPQVLEALAREKGYADVEAMAAEAFGASVEALETFADLCNRGYMYFTHLSHYIEPTAEELDAFYGEQGIVGTEEDISVSLRQILLVPGETVFESGYANTAAVTVAEDGTITCGEEVWAACEADAQKLLDDQVKKSRNIEAAFADAAHKYSRDPGSAVNGGWYGDIRKGQMTKVIDDWCFDPARQSGDTAIIRSEYGVHILYFSESQPVSREEAEQEYYRQRQNALIAEAKGSFPMEVAYSSIQLQEAQAAVSVGEILYPDIAHERFPEVPLYLQQDYPDTLYGAFWLRNNGCGITSLAMLASYMADDELTPPEMCARYGSYSFPTGTDGMIFKNEPAVLGFYLREITYDAQIALEALKEGYIVVSLQRTGYWTRAGHYIVCESIDDEGLIQVRDSNIFNYTRIQAHAEDAHEWGSITAAAGGFWIYDNKITRIPACSRCGDPEGVTESLLDQDYICEKCGPALLRRNTYLDN